MDKVVKQVGSSGGWMLITSKDNSTKTLLETGMKFQRMLLKVRERNIAVHPMTQILEEQPFRSALNASVGLTGPIQFILRMGYPSDYPAPVSLRRPVGSFVACVMNKSGF